MNFYRKNLLAFFFSFETFVYTQFFLIFVFILNFAKLPIIILKNIHHRRRREKHRERNQNADIVLAN